MSKNIIMKSIICVFCSFIVIITVNYAGKVLTKSESDYFPQIPEVYASTLDGLPNVEILRCTNVDVTGTDHYAAYVIAYDYEILKDFQLSEESIDEILSNYFNRFQNILESFYYEDFKNEETLLYSFQEMKLYLNEVENETGVKMYLDLNAVYSNLIEGINDDYYHSFDHIELSKLCFDLDINKKQPGEIFIID